MTEKYEEIIENAIRESVFDIETLSKFETKVLEKCVDSWLSIPITSYNFAMLYLKTDYTIEEIAIAASTAYIILASGYSIDEYLEEF